MPHIAARYTPDQRDAIRRLMDDEGRTAAEAVALAAEGVYGLEPFEMPASSAPQIARRERAKQERMELAELERGSPEGCLLATRRWLFERHRAEVRCFCSERQAGGFDAEHFRWLLRMQREMERPVRGPQQRSAEMDFDELSD